MAINPDRTTHLATLDPELQAFVDAGLFWLEDVSKDDADARIASLMGLYVDVRSGPCFDERNDVLNETRLGIWIKHPPTGTP